MRMDHVHACVRVFVPARGRAHGMQQQENLIHRTACPQTRFNPSRVWHRPNYLHTQCMIKRMHRTPMLPHAMHRIREAKGSEN